MSHSFFDPERTLEESCWGSLRGMGQSHREKNWTYLLQGVEQRYAPGIGATDKALGVLQTESHHGWVDHRGWDADGTVVSQTF